MPGAHVSGTDIDESAITWLAAELLRRAVEGHSTTVNGHLPPLQAASAHYDALYAVSVFTHLPVQMQDEWMDEWTRIVRPGGYLLLTTQNEDLAPLQFLDEASKSELRTKGVLYKHWNNRTEGLPEFYQACWHTEDYLRSHWNDKIRLVKYARRGISGHQDYSLYQVL